MAKSNNKISIANWLSLIGLAGIGAGTFFGIMMQNADGKLGGAIIGAVVAVAAMAFLLWMAIKAKGAEESPEKWRIIMWASIVLYVVVAFIVAKPFNRFFYVIDQKETMKNQALTEVTAINNIYQQYEHQRNTALDNAQEQFQNYIDSHQTDKELAQYVADKKLSNAKTIKAWRDKADKVTKLPADVELAEIKSMIAEWNYLNIPSLAARLEKRDISAASDVEEFIGKYRASADLIPVIETTVEGSYFRNGVAQFELPEAPQPLFAEQLRSAEGSTALGWIVYVLLNLVILFCIVVAPRGVSSNPVVTNNTGGVSL